MPPANPQRYGVLDAYRFIAAAGVVLYHCEAHFQPLTGETVLVLERFHLFVDFFFVLSGFVLMHTYGARIKSMAAFKTFLRKRLARIYPLHAVITLMFVGAGFIFTATHFALRDPGSFSQAAAPAHLALVHAWGLGVAPALNFASWSISAEFFVYLLFPVLALLVVKLSAWRALALAYALGIAMTLARDHAGLRPWEQTTFDFGNLRAIPSFLAGMAVQALLAGRSFSRMPVGLAHAAAVVLAGLMLAQVNELAIVALFPGVIALIAAAEQSGAASRLQRGLWLKLGDASYGVYLIHTLVIMAILVLVRKLGLVSPPQLLVAAVVALVTTTLLALVSFRWFENPARRYFGGGGTGRQTVSAPAE